MSDAYWHNCHRCGHHWKSRDPHPYVCPRCRTRRWQSTTPWHHLTQHQKEQMVVSVLKEAGKPLTTNEILERLRERRINHLPPACSFARWLRERLEFRVVRGFRKYTGTSWKVIE